MNTVAIVLAAGQGKRMKANVNKQFLQLQGKPVLFHTLKQFVNHPLIDGILVVAREEEIQFCQEEVIQLLNDKKIIGVVAGGKERQDSVQQGLNNLPAECKVVVVHDGARPLVTSAIITETIKAISPAQGAIVAVPVKDTIKRVNEQGIVVDTPIRSELYMVQTPQGFNVDVIKNAYQKAFEEGFYGTDDASLVERLGIEIKVVDGSYENIKITTPEDLVIAESIIGRK